MNRAIFNYEALGNQLGGVKHWGFCVSYPGRAVGTLFKMIDTDEFTWGFKEIDFYEPVNSMEFEGINMPEDFGDVFNQEVITFDSEGEAEAFVKQSFAKSLLDEVKEKYPEVYEYFRIRFEAPITK